ncbi:MAG: prolipoprotein diacylglyceryl transferase [Chitinophagales bacterium]
MVLAFIHWAVNPDIPLPFDWFTLQWYGLMWTLSILGCFFLGRWILRQENLSEDHLVLLIQYIFIGAIIGARLGQVLFYDLHYFIAHPFEVVKVWKGGLASHGGILGGLAAIFLFHKRYPQFRLQWLFDRVALVIFLPAALIRLGNLFNSELYGIPTAMPWGFIFERVDQIPRHAVVLYESVAYLVLQILIISIYRRQGERPWFYVGCFFTGVFLVRFLLEFLKVPEGELLVGFISKTQLLSIPAIALGIFFLIKSGANSRNV